MKLKILTTWPFKQIFANSGWGEDTKMKSDKYVLAKLDTYLQHTL